MAWDTLAAEMSFQLAPSPLQALPVILDSISKATQAHEARDCGTREDIGLDAVVPAERTVH